MNNHSNLTTPEAAHYLRVSHRTLIRWRNERKGPTWTKVGHRVLYQRDDLDRYLGVRRIEPVRGEID